MFDAQLFTEVTLDLQQQTLALEKIQFNSNMIDLTGYLKASQLNAQLQYEGTIQIASFSPKALLQQLQMDVPETTDSQVLQKFVMGFVGRFQTFQTGYLLLVNFPPKLTARG